MEKRFELHEEGFGYWIHDHDTKKNFGNWDLDHLTDLLNEQDEKIKELEKDVELWKSKAEHMLNVCKEQSAKDLKKIYDFAEENQKLKQQLEEKIKELKEKLETKESINRAYEATLRLKDYDFSDLVRENQQLKQSQNSKAIEVLEKVKDFMRNTYIEDFIDNQITELGGVKNEQS